MLYSTLPTIKDIPMEDRIWQMFVSLQFIKSSDNPENRWYAVRSEAENSDGPFYYEEIAYLINSGRLNAQDIVLDSKTRRYYLIGSNFIFSKWLIRSEENSHKLYQGIIQCVWNHRGALDPKNQKLPGWALSESQRKALRIMNLDKSVTSSELKQRHRQLLLTHHPKLGGDLETMKEIDWAYHTIKEIL